MTCADIQSVEFFKLKYQCYKRHRSWCTFNQNTMSIIFIMFLPWAIGNESNDVVGDLGHLKGSLS